MWLSTLGLVLTPPRELHGRKKHAGWEKTASDRISDFVYSSKPSRESLQKIQSFQFTHTSISASNPWLLRGNCPETGGSRC